MTTKFLPIANIYFPMESHRRILLMKYGSFKYGEGTNYNESASSFTDDTATTSTFSVEGGFGDGEFGAGDFGTGEHGAITVTYSTETSTTVVYS